MIGTGRLTRLVAEREIRERVRGRTFLFSTAIVVAVVVAGVVLPSLGSDKTTFHVGSSGEMPAGLSTALRASAAGEDAEIDLHRYRALPPAEAALRQGSIGVLIVDGRRLVWKSEPDDQLAGVANAAVARVRAVEEAAALGLSAAETRRLLATPVPARHLEAPDPDRDAREIVAMIGALGLLTVLLWYGMAVAQGVAQEKSDRVMEVLLSRVNPRELLSGKVLGIGLVGLAQVTLALLAALLAIVAFRTLDIPSAVPATLVVTVVWFVLGYAFWSVGFAAVGAMVPRFEDLESATSPLTWTLTICAVGALFAAGDPDVWYIRLASFIPVTAPFVMPVRIALGDVPIWETLLAAAITIGAAVGLIRLAADIYSGALLRSSARPRPADIWRAVKAGRAQ